MQHLKMNGEELSCHLLCRYDAKHPGMVFTRPYTAKKSPAAKKPPNKHPTHRLFSSSITAPPADGSTVCIIHLNTHKIKFLTVKYKIMIWGKIQIRYTRTKKPTNKQNPREKTTYQKNFKKSRWCSKINENLTER